MLSRVPAVGEAYAADEHVWHGPFKRPTIQAPVAAVRAIADGPAPALPIHGEEDQLAPLSVTREEIERIRGAELKERVYPAGEARDPQRNQQERGARRRARIDRPPQYDGHIVRSECRSTQATTDRMSPHSTPLRRPDGGPEPIVAQADVLVDLSDGVVRPWL